MNALQNALWNCEIGSTLQKNQLCKLSATLSNFLCQQSVDQNLRKGQRPTGGTPILQLMPVEGIPTLLLWIGRLSSGVKERKSLS